MLQVCWNSRKDRGKEIRDEGNMTSLHEGLELMAAHCWLEKWWEGYCIECGCSIDWMLGTLCVCCEG